LAEWAVIIIMFIALAMCPVVKNMGCTTITTITDYYWLVFLQFMMKRMQDCVATRTEPNYLGSQREQ
jgi:hypothetical protein